MAKISALGDKEVARWCKPNGAYVILTEQGRLLSQWIKGDAYHVGVRFRRNIPLERRLELVENYHFAGTKLTKVETR